METRKNWEKLGQDDPLFAVLTYKDKRGGKWNKQDFFDTGKREVQESINYLNSLGISISPHSALDFGCGVGRLSQALSEYFDEVHGVDIADSMIKLAEEFNHYKTKCKYYVNKNDNLKLFPDNKFSLIYSKITLQHMDQKYATKYLKEFLRVLKPNGLLLFQLPSKKVEKGNKNFRSRVKEWIPDWLMWFYRKLTPNARPLIEMYGINKEKIVRLMEDDGAKVIDIKQTNEAGEKWISYQYIVRKMDDKKKLNLGCGRDIKTGWINLDSHALPGVDIIHNISNLPLPFYQDQFDEILCNDILEHMTDYIPVLRDLHRITKPGGKIIIRVPHFTSRNNFVDPTHKRLFSAHTFDFFAVSSPFSKSKEREYYFDFHFSKIKKRTLTFETNSRLFFYNRIISLFVNRSWKTQFYFEATGISRIFPAQNIIVELIK